MLLFASLAPFVVLATTVAADAVVARDSSFISLPMVRNIPPPGSVNLARHRKRFEKRRLSNPNVGTKDLSFVYTISIGVGTPPTKYDLIVDTGSSNTWLGANKPYTITNTSVETRDVVKVTYGLGDFIGIEYNDTVWVSPGLAINQSIGVASFSEDIYPQDGILGLGPNALTLNTLLAQSESIIPTVTSNLYASGKIKHNFIAVSFQPTNQEPIMGGEVTFGNTDSSKYTGNIHYVPVTKKYPSSRYWGVNAAVRYGDKTKNSTILKTTAGIVDTGTTLLGLATGAFNDYLKATGAVLDENTTLPLITSDQYNNLKSLFFDIGGQTYELNPNAQLWPRALNYLINGDEDKIYLAVGDSGVLTNGTLDFILGITFLNRFYSVYDTANHRVGFATTQFTDSNSN